ncbi:hypothetical protein BJF78_11080 [Pseudonocardia sp. CNS-139]|nr:hypothetical protein BJF78_11080 [Pseudonocardia sp. CNS-139]
MIPELDLPIPAQRTSPVTPVEPPAQAPVVAPCTCGHPKSAHEHYRPGTDCGACGPTACASYKPEKGFWSRLLGG